MKLFKVYIADKKKILFIFIFLTALIIFINFCGNYYAQQEIRSLTEQYGTQQSIPSDELKAIEFKFSTLDSLFIGGLIGATASAFNELYTISLQNSVSRKSLRKSCIALSLILSIVSSLSMLIITAVSDRFFEYTEIQTWFTTLNSGLTDSKPIIYLLYFAQWLAEGMLFTLFTDLIIMSSKKYQFTRLFAVAFAAMLILVTAAVSTLEYETYALQIALIAFALFILIGFWRLFRTMSLEYKL